MSDLSDSDPVRRSSSGSSDGLSWLRGGGRIATQIAERDWTGTSLGPLEDWPKVLTNTLSLVLNSGLSMLIAWGDELRIFYNDAYAPILSGKADTLGRPFAEVFPETWEETAPLLRKALAGEATFFENFPATLERDGVLRESWWTFSFSPITDDAGEIRGIFAPVHEVTDRIAAEALLRESKNDLQMVSDIVPSMLWRMNADEKLIWKNRRMQEYFGETERAVWFHPDDVASRATEWVRAQADGSTFHHSHRLRRADGTYRWHVATSEPRYDDHGVVQEWIGMSTDIHDMRMAAEALEESEDLFRSFASNSTDMLWVSDVKSGELEYLSPAFENIWGPRPVNTPLTWDYWLSTVHPDDRGQQEEALERLLTGEVLHEEYRIVRMDGSIRWIRDTMFPIISPDRMIRKVAGIAQDITRENRMIVHVIDADPDTRSMVSQRLQAIGYQVRSFANVEPFLRVARALLPGCVLFYDHDDGVEARRLARALKDQVQRLPMVLVHQMKDAVEAVDLMKLGVSDILRPGDLDDKLDQAVATALTTMQASAREDHATQSARDKVQALTERERQILTKLSEGATNKMIARDIGLSPRTVETYRIRILERLGVATLPEAVKLAAIASI